MQRRTSLIGGLCAAVGAGAAATAASDLEVEPAPIVSFILENDFFASTDRHYTNGIRLSWLTAPGDDPVWLRGAMDVLPFVSAASRVRFEYALGQNMYTPSDTDVVIPDPADRPYAGWLYFNFGLVAENGHALDQIQLGLGVVGPSSYADEAQKAIHRLTGETLPMGWDSQIPDELTLQLTYQHSWRAWRAGRMMGLSFDLTPHAGFALGNALTYANLGLTLRFGSHLPDDYGPPRIAPTLAGSSFFEPVDWFGWYVFIGFDGRVVARNLFLEGSTFRDDSPGVESKTLVGDLQFGAAFVVSGARLAYTHVLRTREFEGQGENDGFGAVSLSVRY